MLTGSDVIELSLGFSPDADDVAMWWPIVGRNGTRAIDPSPFRFEAVTEDIESLNRRSMLGELEITAMSCAQYAFVSDTYAITSCGCSMGDRFGPKLVAKPGVTLPSLLADRGVIAVPGERTTAFAALSVLLGQGGFAYTVVPFDRVIDTVLRGEAAAGLLIHESQLTFESQGLLLLADVAQAWSARFGLPLPLGINAIRRDLDDRFGAGTVQSVTNLLHASVAHAMLARRESFAVARMAAPASMSDASLREYLARYVNGWTLKLGSVGRLAIERLLDETARIGLGPRPVSVDVVEAVPSARTG